MDLSAEELERVAEIARIPLDDGERARFEEELEAILEDFAALDEAFGDAEAVTKEETLGGALRPDEADPPDEAVADAIVAAFPVAEDRLLSVPRGLR